MATTKKPEDDKQVSGVTRDKKSPDDGKEVGTVNPTPENGDKVANVPGNVGIPRGADRFKQQQ